MTPTVTAELDRDSESLRYIVTATLNGKILHRMRVYGLEDEGLKKMEGWLALNGYSREADRIQT